MDDAKARNVEWWNERAQLHGQDAYYDVAAFLGGGSALIEREIDEVHAAVGSVKGMDLLHLQCHFGLETLSWARLGAQVTGVDFSPVAIDKAKKIAKRAGLDATFVEADVLELPVDLHERFDIVFASEGSLCWISDVDRWMTSAAQALRPRGRLILIDGHPLLQMVASVDPFGIEGCYQGGVATRYEARGSYADPTASTLTNETIQFAHGLGEIVTAATRAGFHVDALTEWTDNPRRHTDERFTRIGDTCRFEVNGADLPCQFSLRATKASISADRH